MGAIAKSRHAPAWSLRRVGWLIFWSLGGVFISRLVYQITTWFDRRSLGKPAIESERSVIQLYSLPYRRIRHHWPYWTFESDCFFLDPHEIVLELHFDARKQRELVRTEHVSPTKLMASEWQSIVESLFQRGEGVLIFRHHLAEQIEFFSRQYHIKSRSVPGDWWGFYPQLDTLYRKMIILGYAINGYYRVLESCGHVREFAILIKDICTFERPAPRA